LAVALLVTKLSQVVVAQTSKARLVPMVGGVGATDAEMRGRRVAPGCSDRVRSSARSRSWNRAAAVGPRRKLGDAGRATDAVSPLPASSW